MPDWRFISNHGMVLLLIHKDNGITARQLAVKLGITERTVLRIIKQLRDESYLVAEKEGRSNRYRIKYNAPLRHKEVGAKKIGELLRAISLET